MSGTLTKSGCIIVLLCVVYQASSAPSSRKDAIGPCIGMDCLHGILMHGDDKPGESHKSQDTYDRLERADAARKQRRPAGPCRGQDCMEMIAHGDEDPDKVHKMSQKMGPEQNEQPGTANMETILHGGEHVDHSAPRKVAPQRGDQDPATVDMETILHGGEHIDHSAPRKKAEVASEHEPSTVDIEAVLHGGVHVDHSAPRKESKTEDGKVPSTVDMEEVLHGGVNVHHRHGAKHAATHEATKEVDKDSVPMAGDMESMLHGSEDGQHIHTREKKKVQYKARAFGTLDPHALIHGEHKIATGAMDSEEQKDYENWKKTQDTKDADAYSVLGFSFPFISDSIMNEIDMLKRRYMPKFWSDLDEEIGEQIQPLDDGRFDDVTEGVKDEGLGDDMRHELENIGNTEPKDSQHVTRERGADAIPKRRPKRKQEI